MAHLGELSSSYRSCPATSAEGQAALANQLVRDSGRAIWATHLHLPAAGRCSLFCHPLSLATRCCLPPPPRPQVGMLVAMGCSQPLLVKLADRLHDMRTLAALPAAKRNRLAQETLDVWAPLANRLGVWSLKARLEDLAFKQLYPGEVRWAGWAAAGSEGGRARDQQLGLGVRMQGGVRAPRGWLLRPLAVPA